VTPTEILTHLIGTPTHVAVGKMTERGKLWLPSPVQPDEIPLLIEQHLAGAIEPRLVVHGRGEQRHLALERHGLWLGAYAVSRSAEEGAHMARWICIDTDVSGSDHRKGLSQSDCDKLTRIAYDLMAEAGLMPVQERSHSGKGWHLWSLFPFSVNGDFAEWLGLLIAETAARDAGLPEGMKPENFPKNGTPDGLGSLVALPFTGAPRGLGGGHIEGDTHLVAAETIDLWGHRWEDVVNAWDEARQDKERRAREAAHRFGDKRSRFRPDSMTCELVMESLAPHLITDRNESELYCNCPRHASQSKRSMHISRKGEGKWWCFSCNQGGGWWLLARWLLGDDVPKHEVFNKLTEIQGVRA
jgi:hypothetical protein